jgi:hypothetical protein
LAIPYFVGYLDIGHWLFNIGYFVFRLFLFVRKTEHLSFQHLLTDDFYLLFVPGVALLRRLPRVIDILPFQGRFVIWILNIDYSILVIICFTFVPFRPKNRTSFFSSFARGRFGLSPNHPRVETRGYKSVTATRFSENKISRSQIRF